MVDRYRYLYKMCLPIVSKKICIGVVLLAVCLVNFLDERDTEVSFETVSSVPVYPPVPWFGPPVCHCWGWRGVALLVAEWGAHHSRMSPPWPPPLSGSPAERHSYRRQTPNIRIHHGAHPPRSVPTTTETEHRILECAMWYANTLGRHFIVERDSVTRFFTPFFNNNQKWKSLRNRFGLFISGPGGVFFAK